MKGKEYQPKRKKVMRALMKSHIPSVASDTGYGDLYLRKIRDPNYVQHIKRPGADVVEKLYEYFFGDG